MKTPSSGAPLLAGDRKASKKVTQIIDFDLRERHLFVARSFSGMHMFIRTGYVAEISRYRARDPVRHGGHSEGPIKL